MKMIGNSFGTDAEFFLRKADTKEVVSSEGILGGRKKYPIKCAGGGYLEDCVTVEINPDPVLFSDGADKAVANITSCIEEVTKVIAPLNLEASIEPASLFPREQLTTAQSSESGCGRVYDCWTLERLPKISIATTDWRFASGDIHVGLRVLDDYPSRQGKRIIRASLARFLDMFFGLSEVITTPKTKRTDYYGKAGMHRPTPYGVECKVPGNYWLLSEERIKWAFHTAEAAVSYVERNLMDDKFYSELTEADEYNAIALGDMAHYIVEARNSWNKDRAHKLLDRYGIREVPAL